MLGETGQPPDHDPPPPILPNNNSNNNNAPAPPPPFEMDQDARWDGDSAFGSSGGGESRHTSLKSFVRDYYYENGRRYHSFRSGEYYLPNDDREQERLEYYHWCWLMIIGGDLFAAPIGDYPQRVLDLGTGTGTWAIEFADRYPMAEVIGNDLSPIQPSWVPPNCRFVVDDIASPWVYRENESFDFIHTRMLNGSLSDWPRLYEQALENLKPGGWFELQEFEGFIFSDEDPTLEKAPVFRKLMSDVNETAKVIGKDMDISSSLKQGLLDAGFVDVREDLYKVPFGSWAAGKQPKLLGEVLMECVSESIDAYCFTIMTRIQGKSVAEARDFIDRATAEFRNKDSHFYGKFRFVYGQKPLRGG